MAAREKEGDSAILDGARKSGETGLSTIAPVSNNLILAFHGHSVLGLPRSFSFFFSW